MSFFGGILYRLWLPIFLKEVVYMATLLTRPKFVSVKNVWIDGSPHHVLQYCTDLIGSKNKLCTRPRTHVNELKLSCGRGNGHHVKGRSEDPTISPLMCFDFNAKVIAVWKYGLL